MPVLFENVVFHLSPSLAPNRQAELKHVLLRHGAEHAFSIQKATHIITDTNKFEGCQDVSEGVAVVTDIWVERSIILGRMQSPAHYSADPAMIFSGVIACATEIPSTDLEVLSAGITALGGQWRTALTRDVTHLFALSKSSPKYATALHFQPQTKVHIVLPHWFDDSVRLGMHALPVDPYAWPDPPLLKSTENVLENMKGGLLSSYQHHRDHQTSKTDAEKRAILKSSLWEPGAPIPDLSATHETPKANKTATTTTTPFPSSPAAAAVHKNIWQQKRILLSPSLELTSSRRLAVEAGITRAGGVIVSYTTNSGDGTRGEELVLVPQCDVLVTRWRSGRAYVRAVREGKTIGSMGWVFYVQARGVVSRPMDQLLHYPVPRKPVEGFAGHEITVTNYTGEAREYLKKLITTMGATFTPSMSGRNTVLIAAYLSGTKTTKAAAWSIPIVNHTWIEDCFVKWRNLTVGLEKYIVFPPGIDFAKLLGERGVGGGFTVAGGYSDAAVQSKHREAGEGEGMGTGVGVGGWVGLESEEELQVLEREDDEFDVEMMDAADADDEGSVGGEVDRDLVIGQAEVVDRPRLRLETEEDGVLIPRLLSSPGTQSAKEAREVEAAVGLVIEGEEETDTAVASSSRAKAGSRKEVHETGSRTRLKKRQKKVEEEKQEEEEEEEEEVEVVVPPPPNVYGKGGKGKATFLRKAGPETSQSPLSQKTKARVKGNGVEGKGNEEDGESSDDVEFPEVPWTKPAQRSKAVIQKETGKGKEKGREQETTTKGRKKSGKEVQTEESTDDSAVMSKTPRKKVEALRKTTQKGQVRAVVEDDEEEEAEEAKEGERGRRSTKTRVKALPRRSNSGTGEADAILSPAKSTRSAKGVIGITPNLTPRRAKRLMDTVEVEVISKKGKGKKKQLDGGTDTQEGGEEQQTRRTGRVENKAPEKKPRVMKDEGDSEGNGNGRESQDDVPSRRKKPPEASRQKLVRDSSPLSPPPSSPETVLPALERSSKRSAAVKATQKLHNEIMPDMNLFQNQMRRGRVSLGRAEEAGSRAGSVAKKRKGVDEEEEVAGADKVKRRRKISFEGATNERRKEDEEISEETSLQPEKTVRVMTTQVMLSEDVIKVLAKLGVQFTTRSTECTHLVAPGIVRTEKFLCALARAPFILSDKWANASAAAKKLLPEKDYLLYDKAGESKFSFRLKEAIERASKSKLFANKMFYITPKVPAGLGLLKNVITACGGQVSTTSPTIRILNSNPDRHFISCPEDVSIWRPISAHHPVYSQELVLTGALKQSIDWENTAFRVPGSF
ncbi:hypothetical protein AMATHDRAFT_71207 [Amanita thiersii Skay4041]|uniref:BRCT domain-containing protein n=1 Tax=Amanita thiersii Skay4041 TaxID=703135 RepID=A0A2A9N7V8_9AGAR|nr:hypothetical protein AMATHDRAFT_71207 [Amanita thiersii Skay4041]